MLVRNFLEFSGVLIKCYKGKGRKNSIPFMLVDNNNQEVTQYVTNNNIKANTYLAIKSTNPLPYSTLITCVVGPEVILYKFYIISKDNNSLIRFHQQKDH